jgi:hypothetical protein
LRNLKDNTIGHGFAPDRKKKISLVQGHPKISLPTRASPANAKPV